MIPLLDSVYDHVIKRYPRRSYCILRNCVRVSDLIKVPTDTCFELTRGSRTETSCERCGGAGGGGGGGGGGTSRADEGVGIKARLRGRVGSRCGCARLCCAGPGITGPGSGLAPGQGQASRLTRPGAVRRSVRALSSLADTERVKTTDRWVFASRSPEHSQTRSKTRSASKSREILSLLGDSGYSSSSVCFEDSTAGVMTRAKKRSLARMTSESSESLAKRIKVENFSRKAKKIKTTGKTLGKVSFKRNSACTKDPQPVPGTSSAPAPGSRARIHFSEWEAEMVKNQDEAGCCRHRAECGNSGKTVWCEPESISYR